MDVELPLPEVLTIACAKVCNLVPIADAGFSLDLAATAQAVGEVAPDIDTATAVPVDDEVGQLSDIMVADPGNILPVIGTAVPLPHPDTAALLMQPTIAQPKPVLPLAVGAKLAPRLADTLVSLSDSKVSDPAIASPDMIEPMPGNDQAVTGANPPDHHAVFPTTQPVNPYPQAAEAPQRPTTAAPQRLDTEPVLPMPAADQTVRIDLEPGERRIQQVHIESRTQALHHALSVALPSLDAALQQQGIGIGAVSLAVDVRSGDAARHWATGPPARFGGLPGPRASFFTRKLRFTAYA